MWSRVTNLKFLAGALVSIALLGVLACGGAEPSAPAAPAPAAAAAPAAAPMQPAAPAQPLPAQAGRAAVMPAPAAMPAPAMAPEAPKGVGGMTAAAAVRTGSAAPAPAAMAMEGPALASTYPSGMVKYLVPVTMPKTFQEAPSMAALVKAGRLPPLNQRLPDEPLVIAPVEIGEYGGTWRRVYTWANDSSYVSADSLGFWDGDGVSFSPRLLKSLDFSEDGRSLTFALRKGHKWSDGAPFTVEDFKWTFEALMSNREYTSPGAWPFRLYNSPVTGNQPKFDVIDTETFKLTWDDPYFAVVEQGLGHSTFYRLPGLLRPKHYLKQFHADYTDDKAALDRMVEEAGVDSWVDLMKIKVNTFQNDEIPGVNAWITTDGSRGAEWIMQRNPYYFEVDTAGNQLPYIDTIHQTLVENTEAVALKAAAGEVDFQGRHMSLDKVPLYLKNADQTNVDVTFWSCTCPSDAQVIFNQGYGGPGYNDPDADTLIGELVRTRDFRIALSISMDREEIRETFFLGMGQTRGFVPEKGTSYYPGDDYLHKNATLDVKKANALLDGIVLKDGGKIDKRNAQGLRLRPDNGEPLRLHIVTLFAFLVDYHPVSELLLGQWEKAVGIGGTFTPTRDAVTLIRGGKEYLWIWEGGGGQSPWLYSNWTIPQTRDAQFASLVGTWYSTDGEKGEPPTAPHYANPEGEFPLQTLIQLWEDGKGHPLGSAERTKIGVEIYKILVDEMYVMGTVGSSPLVKGSFVRKKNFKGVPALTSNGSGLHGVGPRPETYFFEGGKNDAGF